MKDKIKSFFSKHGEKVVCGVLLAACLVLCIFYPPVSCSIHINTTPAASGLLIGPIK